MSCLPWVHLWQVLKPVSYCSAIKQCIQYIASCSSCLTMKKREMGTFLQGIAMNHSSQRERKVIQSKRVLVIFKSSATLEAYLLEHDRPVYVFWLYFLQS